MSSLSKQARRELRETFEMWKMSPAMQSLHVNYRSLIRNNIGDVLDIFLWHYFVAVIFDSRSVNGFVKNKLRTWMLELARPATQIGPSSLSLCINSYASHDKYATAHVSALPYLIGHLCGVFLGTFSLMELFASALGGMFYQTNTVGNLRWRVFKVALVHRLYVALNGLINKRVYLNVRVLKALKWLALFLSLLVSILLCTRLFR